MRGLIAGADRPFAAIGLRVGADPAAAALHERLGLRHVPGERHVAHRLPLG